MLCYSNEADKNVVTYEVLSYKERRAVHWCSDTVGVMLMCGVRKPVIAPVCGDLQEAVNQCLLANRHQSLNCAAEVRAFNQCVRSQGQVINACLLHLSTVTINSRIMFVAVFRVSLITLCAGPASCRTGVIGFLAGWHKASKPGFSFICFTLCLHW